jgi:Flp pilus assembly pilin Flp
MDGRGRSSRRARRDSGASAVEYGLIIAGAGVVLVALSFATGKAVSGAFLTNATAIGGTPGVVDAADVGGVVDPTTATVAPSTTSAAPTTSSAAPTTTSAAPTTTSAVPTTTSASPTRTSVTPSPVQPSGTTAVSRGSSKTVDVGGSNKSTGFVSSVSPSDAGTVSWDKNGNLVFTPSDTATPGSLVTVTYAFVSGGKNSTDVSGAITFWIT